MIIAKVFRKLFYPNSDMCQDINVAEFEELKSEGAIILDVRTQKEFDAGNIPGAILNDVKQSDFKDKLSGLDKEASYLVYCRSGVRSLTACSIMSGEGFKKLYNLKGGYIAWNK